MILEVRGECVVGRDSLDILHAGTGGKNTGREGTRTGARERNTVVWGQYMWEEYK